MSFVAPHGHSKALTLRKVTSNERRCAYQAAPGLGGDGQWQIVTDPFSVEHLQGTPDFINSPVVKFPLLPRTAS
ncbi:hypothetical protein TNCV_4086221 [Trichonephila clavipes]|nr:hypothetical protein TNCV_4086221 [Trichonephila clavipes]